MKRCLVAAASILLSGPALAQDADAGKRAFLQCRACHTLEAGGRHLAGPNLHGMFGTKAGSKPGYAYSKVLKASDLVWTEALLDKWLADPRGFLPGNKMVFTGVKAPETRKQLIAYLKAETAK